MGVFILTVTQGLDRGHAAGLQAGAGVDLGVEEGGHPGGLNCHQIASDTIHDRLEDSNTIEHIHSILQDQSSTTAQQHGHEDRSPAMQEGVSRVDISPGDPDTDRSKQEVAGD